MKHRLKQQGVALLIFVTVLATAAATVTVTALNNNENTQIDRDKITAAALAQAKDALIGYAAADSTRPGELPCPDVNGDGILSIGVDYNYGNRSCMSFIGQLPWKTLDLPDLRDGANSRLWYAITQDFYAGNTAVLNSDTKGSIPVYTSNDALLTNQAVAIILSPGDPLPGQSRIIANINDANHYLESMNCPGPDCRDNTVATGPFIAGPVLDADRNPSLNDMISVIQIKDLISAIEKRVAKELSNWLQAYFSANHYYPYPAPYDDCNPNNSHHCRGDSSVCRGRIPRSEASGNENWNPPEWFRNNQWYREIYYSVSSSAVQTSTNVVCGTSLTVSGNTANAVFFTPGSPLSTVSRPSNTLSDYLEDTENQDGWSGGANDTYVIPAATVQDRDRLYSLP